MQHFFFRFVSKFHMPNICLYKNKDTSPRAKFSATFSFQDRDWTSNYDQLCVDENKHPYMKCQACLLLLYGHYDQLSMLQSTWPTSYVMEVVTLASWRDAGSPQSFDMGKGFCAVLNSLTNHRNFSVVLHNDMCYAPSMLRRYVCFLFLICLCIKRLALLQYKIYWIFLNCGVQFQ